ncbi:MAG: signal recognition particle-docking protein FtsY, partial [Candidatus Micrarchaeaceae archaeon]
LMLTMLQSDVSYETTNKFINSLKETLKSSSFETRNIRNGISDCVKSELSKVLEEGIPKEQLLQMVKERLSKGMRPVSIMFLGPNGTGKTTTMAKIAYMFKKNGIGSVFSASDTFRAAAIEQTSFHAAKIGMPVIKGSYGADPASVAFDAIEYAKAHGSDTVLIDTAGRQETNKNLLNEIKKMERVAKPDITIYIGESTAGNRIAEQVAEFLKYIKIDGIILTKLDCDAKGGNAISLSDVTGLPIFFFGTGEGYEELIEFNPSFIINSLMPD